MSGAPKVITRSIGSAVSFIETESCDNGDADETMISTSPVSLFFSYRISLIGCEFPLIVRTRPTPSVFDSLSAIKSSDRMRGGIGESENAVTRFPSFRKNSAIAEADARASSSGCFGRTSAICTDFLIRSFSSFPIIVPAFVAGNINAGKEKCGQLL